MRSETSAGQRIDVVPGQQPSLWLGIDLGTQSVKVEIVSEDGGHWGAASAALESRRDGARHEQDPRSWISAVATALAGALQPLDEVSRRAIGGLAICSTSGTLAAVDANGAPIGPGIMYDDGRGAPYLDAVLAADPDHWRGASSPATARHSAPATPQRSWALTKLAWFADTGIPHGAVAVAHQGDVVAAAMTGTPVATDWSSALKSGYDLEQRCWPEKVFTAIGFDQSLLPGVVAPGSRIGETTADWEQLTGLPAGTPIFAGVTDGCASQFGAGALALGSWHSVIGTTLVIKGVTHEPLVNADLGVYSHLAPDGTNWLPGGASSAGAGALGKFLAADGDIAELTRDVRARWHTSPLPVAYPLISTGERFPISAPNFEGFVLPADPHASALPLNELFNFDSGDALTAIFVGLAAVERLCFERLGLLGDVSSAEGSGDTRSSHTENSGIRRLTTSGGGARNADWVRMRASMLGIPITRLAEAEGSLGMAALAAWGIEQEHGAKRSLSEVAERMSQVLDVIHPDPGFAVPLRAAYAQFREHLDTLKAA